MQLNDVTMEEAHQRHRPEGGGLNPQGLEIARDAALVWTEAQLPDLFKAMGKPGYAKIPVRLEQIDARAIERAVTEWDQPERRKYLDGQTWDQIYGRYGDAPHRFSMAVWAGDPADPGNREKETLVSLAAGYIFDDREPRHLDIDFVESMDKEKNPLKGAARFIVTAAAMNTARTAQIPEMRFVDVNPGSEAVFNSMGFQTAPTPDELGYTYVSKQVDLVPDPVQQIDFQSRPQLKGVTRV